MTPERLDAADRECTRAWMGGEVFSRALTWTDLEVYAHDHVKISVAQLARRWKRSELEAGDLCREFVAKHPGWAPSGLGR